MKQTIFPIKVGKPVVMEGMGNYARRGSVNQIIGTVTSIKRKYFYVTDQWRKQHKYAIEDFSYHGDDCNGSYLLYESPKAFEAELTRREEENAIRKFLGSYGTRGYGALSPEDTHAIFEIISKYN